jgi:hypothetical protein
MEVVLASGLTVNANATENPDLFTALKGGSNNFGVVTRFDLQIYPQGNFWGGFIAYPGTNTTITQDLAAFYNYMEPDRFDPYAKMITAIEYESALRSVLVSNGIYYTKPEVDPLVFQPFLKIEPQIENTLRISNISDFVAEEKSQQAPNSRCVLAHEPAFPPY